MITAQPTKILSSKRICMPRGAVDVAKTPGFSGEKNSAEFFFEAQMNKIEI